MRIIAGKYKKQNLFSVPGSTTRPTTDFLREFVFSVMQDFHGLQVLDLFAGTGALSYEALSRGADFADLVEAAQVPCTTIIRNMEKLNCGDKIRLHRQKVSSFLKKNSKQFDVIFIDPPYNKGLITETLDLIFDNGTLASEGSIIVEHDRDEVIPERWIDHMTFQRILKKNAVTILSAQPQTERSSHEDT